ncbi:MAG: S41 family peptidase [Defluviitaleaceae bacterium]|nr:S41 family peptidase [Defluviitaleaceae bacterium]
MENRKSFFTGMAAGVLLMLVFIMGSNAYDRHVRWGGRLSPNQKVMEMYTILNNHSIMDFELDEMLDSMYRGFLAAVGDPYTMYFDLDAVAAFHERNEGTFVGVGINVAMDPDDLTISITNVMQDAPAYHMGLMAGDIILAVDDIDTVGRPVAEVMGMIQGEEGTDVKFLILRPYENIRFEVTITRRSIEHQTVHHRMVEDIGYIRITRFERPTLTQFNAALAELQESGMAGLVIDVRGNPGGMLNIVGSITEQLIPEGFVAFTEDVRGNRHYINSDGDYLGLPLAVLVNGASASASEVLSGAVKDTGVGIIVGEQTFGKGIVQTLRYLSDGTGIKLTISKYFTPSGVSIHGIGVTPDIIVEMEETLSRQIGDLPLYLDVQLQAALESIRQR